MQPLLRMSLVGLLVLAGIAISACTSPDAAATPPANASTPTEDDLIKQFGGPRLLSQIPAMALEPIGAADPALASEPVAIPSQNGQPMIVVFVSAECAACLRDTPYWLALRRKASERNARFVIVSIEQSREKVETFARILQAAHTGLRDVPVLYSRTIGPTLRIGFVPFYLLIDKDGRMRGRGVGLTPESTTDDQRAEHFLQLLESAGT